MNNKRLIYASVGALLLISCLALLLSGSLTLAQSPNPQKEKKSATHGSQPSAGQIKFEQNCSRCHNAPQGFSPRISGTVVRHMRVRASLSKKDAEDILHFLNP